MTTNRCNPYVAGLIDKIELVDVINNIVGIAADEKITTGEVVKAMLLNGLGFFTSPEAILANQLGKSTKTPTLRWIFQQFQGLHVVESQGQVQITNLTNCRPSWCYQEGLKE